MICKKCGNKFEPSKGLKNYCSLQCRNSRSWSVEDKQRKSLSAKNSDKVRVANDVRKQEKIQKICPMCGDSFSVHVCHKKRIYCSRKCYHLDDHECKYRKVAPGGCRKGSGTGKSGWYNGIWCDSSYELVWVIYMLDHNISFERNKTGFEYSFDEKIYKYYPDFKIGDMYIEIKGYHTKKFESKVKKFPHPLRILYREDLQKEFEYVETKYGANFIELYNGNPHKIKNNMCLVCGKPANKLYCSRRCSGIAVSRNKTGHVV